jgi:hypothetical protein
MTAPFQLFDNIECEYYISEAEKKGLAPGIIYSPDDGVRTNTVAWIPLQPEHYSRIWNLGNALNCKWFEHPVQISCYSPGEFYSWHDDLKPGKDRTSCRDKTLTCTLKSAPGAVFETSNQTYNLQDGYAVIFDSATLHRATAPISGNRWALTVWFMRPNI